MNKAQIGFHLVVIINSYAAKPIEKAGRRTPGGGGTLGISGWGCAAGTLEPLTFTRAS